MAAKNLSSSLAVFLVVAGMAISSGQPAPGLPQTFRDPAAVELRNAIQKPDPAAVQLLLQNAATNDCLEVDEQGQTALHYAVKLCASESADPKPFEILKLLASRTNCVNAPDRLGRKAILELQPLAWASRSKMDALAILLANGADVNARDDNGVTLLDQVLRTWDDSAIHWPELLDVLLKAGANPNLPDAAGKSAMHYFFGPTGFCSKQESSRATRIAVAQKVFTQLMNAGATLTNVDNEGTTPVGTMLLQYEVFYGTKETILAFATPELSKTLQVKSALIKKRPALIYLCDKPQTDPELIGRLLDLGADPKAAEPDGFTALHGAAWFYNFPICALLVERRADANAVNVVGRTPLHELVRSSYCTSPFLETDKNAGGLRAAKVLVAHGANRRLKDKEGKMPYDLLKDFDKSEPENQAAWKALRKLLKP